MVTAADPHRRRRPLVVRELPMLAVLAAVAAGLGMVVAERDYEPGVLLFAGAVCLAALLRAVLPNGAAGMLRVRSRAADVLALGLLGAAGVFAALALILDWTVAAPF